MATKSTDVRILNLHKSRETILELAATQGYDVSEYEGFSIQEIEAMLNNNQLDMMVIKNRDQKDQQKLYVHFYLGTVIKTELKNMLEDLYDADSPTLNKKTDGLIVVVDSRPSENIVKRTTELFDHDGIYVSIFHIERLLFNVLKHELQPKRITILNDAEVEEYKMKYKTTDLNQIPEISRYDPLAMAIFMRPGQICHLLRKCRVAGTSDYYRVCV